MSHVTTQDWTKWDFIHPLVYQALLENNFLHPTDIQSYVLNCYPNYNDFLVASQTGSGKTLSFGIPIVSDIINQKTGGFKEKPNDPKKGKKYIRCLIIAPTRELVLQIEKHLNQISQNAKSLVRIGSIVGGLSKDKQRRTLSYIPDILVATPGRLWDMIDNFEHECLDRLHMLDFLVMDEADRMVELGHFDELDKILERVYNKGELTENKGEIKKINELIKNKQTKTISFQTKSGKVAEGLQDLGETEVMTIQGDDALNMLKQFKKNKQIADKDLKGVDLEDEEEEHQDSEGKEEEDEENEDNDDDEGDEEEDDEEEEELNEEDLDEDDEDKEAEDNDEDEIDEENEDEDEEDEMGELDDNSDEEDENENGVKQGKTNEKKNAKLQKMDEDLREEEEEGDDDDEEEDDEDAEKDNDEDEDDGEEEEEEDDDSKKKHNGKLKVFLVSATLTKQFAGNKHKIKTLSKKEKKKASKLRKDRKKGLITDEKEDKLIPKMEALLNKVKFTQKYKVIDLTTTILVPRNLKECKTVCVEEDKPLYLYHYIKQRPNESIIVFTNSISYAKKILHLLTILGLKVLCLHSEMQQRQRFKKLDQFKNGEYNVLVSTDVAARGLDIPSVQNVVHYQVPLDIDTFIHRSGRTARIGNAGTCYTLVGPKDGPRFSKIIAQLEKEQGIANVDINHTERDKIRVLIESAQQLEKSDFLVRQKQVEKAWYSKNAKLAELEVDDEIKQELGQINDEISKKRIVMKHDKVEFKKIKDDNKQIKRRANNMFLEPSQIADYARRLEQLKEQGKPKKHNKQTSDETSKKPNHFKSQDRSKSNSRFNQKRKYSKR